MSSLLRDRGERDKPWPWRLVLAGASVVLVLLALNPLVVRYDPPAPASAVVVASTPPPECEITGLAEYGIREVQSGACSPHVYVRACRDAQLAHRERCQEFCGALKEVGGRAACRGESRPVAHLFDPEQHCHELRHDQFEVFCRVSSACSCVASALQASG